MSSITRSSEISESESNLSSSVPNKMDRAASFHGCIAGFLSSIQIEPLCLLFAMGDSILIMVVQTYYIDRICLITKGYDPFVCQNLTHYPVEGMSLCIFTWWINKLHACCIYMFRKRRGKRRIRTVNVSNLNTEWISADHGIVFGWATNRQIRIQTFNALLTLWIYLIHRYNYFLLFHTHVATHVFAAGVYPNCSIWGRCYAKY